MDAASAVMQHEEIGFGVLDLDADAPPPRLVDDDAGIGVEPRFRLRADIEPFVDRILALQAEAGKPLEAQLFV